MSKTGIPEFIKIVELPACRVISFHVRESRAPEQDAIEQMSQWAIGREIFENPSTFHIFGFNNPIPSDTELRGYEVWITIPDGYDVGTDVIEKRFEGGLYAVMRIRGADNIGAAARRLFQWVKESSVYEFGYPKDYDFEKGPSLELEQIISPPKTRVGNILIDYYLPVIDEHPNPTDRDH